MEEERRKSRAAKTLDSDLETAGSNHGSNNGPLLIRWSTSSDSEVIQCQRLLLLQKREKKKEKIQSSENVGTSKTPLLLLLHLLLLFKVDSHK